MIQEELKNYIEQNCSGKEPSDLIMEVIGRKIEQFGADADEVLAFVEECAKGPTLEQKAEDAKCKEDLLAFLKSELKRYLKDMRYSNGIIRYGSIRLFSKDVYESRSKYFEHCRKAEEGKMDGLIIINNIKEDANLYIDDKEICSLLNEIREKEAKILYIGAMDEIKHLLMGDKIWKYKVDDVGKALNTLRFNYSDVVGISIPDLEALIDKAYKKQAAQKEEVIQEEVVKKPDEIKDLSIFERLKKIFN